MGGAVGGGGGGVLMHISDTCAIRFFDLQTWPFWVEFDYGLCNWPGTKGWGRLRPGLIVDWVCLGERLPANGRNSA